MKAIYPATLVVCLFTSNIYAQSYELTDLGAVVGKDSYAQGINDQGKIVGYWEATNGAHAFLYESGEVSDLGLLGSSGSNNYALSINNVGQVVGFSEGSNGPVAFLYQNGVLTNLDAILGVGSYAFGVNENGQIVGHVTTSAGARAYLYNNGTVISLGTLGGTNSYAYGVNNALQIAGSSLEADNTAMHAFLWQNGIITDLNQLLPYNSGWELLEAHGINDYGNISGWGTINGQEQGFLYYAGGWAADLGTLAGGTNSYALGLNNSNQVVGASSCGSGTHAVVWEDGATYDLNNLVNAPGWELKEACSINNLGQIVGWGIVNGQEHAYLLTPISNQSSSALSGQHTFQPLGLPPSGSLTVSITNPPQQAIFVPGSNINLGASATDSGGTVTQVQFFFGTNLIGKKTSSPYTYTWTNPAVGTYPVTAQATDNNGLMATSSVSVFYVSPLTNMVAWWRAEGSAADSVGTNNGTLQGGASFTNGVVGQAFSLNGSVQAVAIPYSPSTDLSAMSAWTIEAWINPASFNNQAWPTIYAKGYWDVSFGLNSTGGQLESWINNANQLVGTLTVSTGRWSHVALVYNGTNRIFYLNGVYAGSGAAPGIVSDSNASAIGAVGSIDSRSCFSGAIDEVSIYSRALSSNEIAAIYNAGAAGKIPGFNVTLTNPVNNAIIPAGANISLSATASDPNGTVRQVAFFQGTNSLGMVTNAPYSLIWTNPANGAYALSASALDNNGLVTTSAPVNIIVENPPSVTLTNPVNNAVIAVGSNIGLGATASDSDGSVAQVQFFQGNTLLGTVVGAPYVLVWTNPPTGTYSLTAQAEDNNGLISTSSPVTVIVDIPPSVALTNPADNSVLVATQTNVTLAAVATDSDGSIAQVQFFRGTNNLGTVTNSPFALVLSNAVAGAYAFTAVATDNQGLSTTSTVANLLITPVWIAITNPASDTIMIASQTNVNLGVTISDVAGNVTQVQYFQNAISLGTNMTAPYGLIWSNALAGSYGVTAVVMDDVGNSITSPVVNLTISSLLASNNLVLWLKADQVSGLSNNAHVATWLDDSGWNDNASQTSGSQQPLWIVNVINGYPSLYFNAMNTYFNLSQFPTNLSQAEAFVVLKASVTNQTDYQPLWYLGAYNASVGGYPSPGGHIIDGFESWSTYDIGYPAQPLTQFHVYEVVSQTNNWTAWLNGLLQLQSTVNTVGGVHSGGLVSTAQLGSSWVRGFGGYIAEVLVFDRALTAGERNIVNTYLNGKYALVPAVPPTPTNLVASAISPTQVALTWDVALSGGVTQTSIERATASNGTFAVVAQLPNTLSYVDTNLTVGTTYYYRVRAVNLATWSGYTSLASATTPSSGTNAPFGSLALWLKADAGLLQSSSNTAVNIWLDQSGNGDNAAQPNGSLQPQWTPGVLGDRPAIWFSGGHYFNLPSFPTNLSQAEAFVVLKASVTNQTDQQPLWYLGAYNASVGGYPATSGDIVDGFESWNYYDLGPPVQPLTQFHMYEVVSQTNNWEAWINGLLQFQTSANSVGGVQPSGLVTTAQLGGSWVRGFGGYIAEVLVFNRGLTADERQTVGSYLNLKYTLVTNMPTAPLNLTAGTSGLTQVNLAWSNTTALAQIQIERKTDSSGSYAVIAVVGQGTTNYIDSSLVSGHIYFYRVRASNLAGYSPYSNEAAVLVNLPPTVSLNSPTNGELFISPANIPLSATASDSDGTVSNVAYFVGGTTNLGTSTNPPNYSITWSNVPGGIYSLTASATDNLGGVSNSTPVVITVSNPPPIVSLTSPTNSQFYFAPAIIIVTAAASDPNGSVSRVDFFVASTNKIRTVFNSPYTIYWTNLTTGNYPLTAVATDNEGATSTSSVVNVTVSNTPPSISIVTPTNNALFQAPATIPFVVNASDANGYVVKVDYYNKATNFIGESTVSPFSLTWSNVLAGTNSITATATDDGGAWTTSSAVTVIVNAQPTVSITNPVNYATYPTSTNITINAIASDSDGTVSRVDFYYGINNLIGSDTTSPYSIVLTNAPMGTYALTAKATDNRGGVTVSSPITISVGTNLSDIADSYVNESSASSNYGTQSSLLVETNGATVEEDAYFKFDTTGIGNVTGAKLNVYAEVSKKNDAVGVGVYATSTNWTETGITWNNRPPLGGILAITNISNNSYVWYTFDITGYLQSQKAAGSNVISLAIHATNSTSWYVSINSKEASSNKPFLLIYNTNSPPTVAITSPTNYAVFLPGTNEVITANAADSDGRIYQVQFFADATSLGTVTNGSYAVTWTNVPSGAHALTAVATDNFGAQTTSSVVYVLNDVNPNTTDSDGDGIPDGWEALWGLSPTSNDWAQPNNRANYGYTPADWFNSVTGTKTGSVSLDNEGNVLQVTQ